MNILARTTRVNIHEVNGLTYLPNIAVRPAKEEAHTTLAKLGKSRRCETNVHSTAAIPTH